MNHPPTILVTGGTGFVGSHLLRLLVNKGLSVRATKRPNSNLYWVDDVATQIEWVDCDINDPQGLYDAMANIEQVYHSAALVSFDRSKQKLLHETNVEGTANVVNMALERGVKKLLHVSSIASIGRKLNQPQVDETIQWEDSPINTQYAISKNLAEREVWRGVAEGLSAVIVNPSVIIGEGEWSTGSCRLFTQVWEGLKFYPLGGTGFVDVLDLVQLMVELMDSDIQSERFIVNAHNLSYREFFGLVARSLEKPEPSRPITPLIAEIGWRLEALKGFFTKTSPLVTKETARMSQHRYYYHNNKLLSATPFAFTPIEESVSRICKEFLAAHQQ
jgi:dihydroflavonol-4-reductase